MDNPNSTASDATRNPEPTPSDTPPQQHQDNAHNGNADEHPPEERKSHNPIKRLWRWIQLGWSVSTFHERLNIILTLLITSATIAYATSAYLTLNEIRQNSKDTHDIVSAAYPSWWYRPYVNLTEATVFKIPADKSGIAMVQWSLTNKGSTPAKNVRVLSRLQIRPTRLRLCPPLENDFPENGTTYPSDVPQHMIEQTAITPTDLAAYESGDARLYLWGRLLYLDYWSDNPDPLIGIIRSSVFCYSFGIENEMISRINPAQGALGR